MSLSYENVKPHIGARVHIDPKDIEDPAVVQKLLELLDERVVLVFPGIGLTDEQQLAFTDALGDRVDFSRKNDLAKAAPDVYQITLDPEINLAPQYVLGTFFWHMDGVTVDGIPLPKATLLSARKISEEGGQTEFANLFAAYEGLPEDEKAAIDDLRVVHSVYSSVRPLLSFDVTPENWGGPPNAKEHPLVWKHSSGRKSLVLGTHAESVVGMTLPEGRALLARLLEWAGQPDYTYRHHWTVGDFVVWNNTAALHRVLPYDKSSGRMMHRTSIAGVEMVE